MSIDAAYERCRAFIDCHLQESGKAIRRDVEIGHRSQFEAEVLSGIAEGALVIVHPTNQIGDGAKVENR